MKNKVWRTLALGLTVTALMMMGTVPAFAEEETTAEATAKDASEGAETEEASEGTDADQEAADQAAALIDAIYVQERTETTDEDIKAAKEAWDGLTEEQKALVEGEEASPDYFGLDTGDASLDDSRNQDEIGENELLVVSFGTSYNDSRVEDIKAIEDAIQDSYPDWAVRRAFTAQIIINHVEARDGEAIDNMQQALDRAVENGVKHLVVQPTHLMHGAEYDEMTEAIEGYKDKFEAVSIAEPLLGEVGNDASVINADKEAVAKAVVDAAVADAGYESMDKAAEEGTAFVFLGHGTSHTAKISYSQMQTQMEQLGFVNAFIGTVEGEPEDTACEAVIGKVKEAGYTKVVLRPLMVVAGDHANNDMAGSEEDSWKSMFEASGSFESVGAQIAGLGRIDAVKQLYVDHTKAAIDSLKNGALEDGIYSAQFNTDSSMFHVNEANEGRGTLTVKNGEMTIHVSLVSKSIVNLFPGLAEDAGKEGAELLLPTTDSVTYSDGYTEEVYGFDIPVPVLDEEFDVALLGKKGKWYDHKVSVTDPRAEAAPAGEENGTVAEDLKLEDGSYMAEVVVEGGSGKASVESPAVITIQDQKATARIIWSSSNYDYMVVDGQKYEVLNTEGNSTFEIPISGFDYKMAVTADTLAMGTPHEIEYTVTFDSTTLKKAEE